MPTPYRRQDGRVCSAVEQREVARPDATTKPPSEASSSTISVLSEGNGSLRCEPSPTVNWRFGAEVAAHSAKVTRSAPAVARTNALAYASCPFSAYSTACSIVIARPSCHAEANAEPLPMAVRAAAT
jgi:hypothetical protein